MSSDGGYLDNRAKARKWTLQMKQQQNMNKSVMWLIRDARGLSTSEKVFLFTVASRGMVKTSRTRLMGDTGMSTGSITNIVRSLQAKGLINVYPSTYSPITGKRMQTFYSIDTAAMTEWNVTSLDELLSSGDESEYSRDELPSSGDESECSGDGVKGDNEGNNEVDIKVTVKKSTVVVPPTVESKIQAKGIEELQTSTPLLDSNGPTASLPLEETSISTNLDTEVIDQSFDPEDDDLDDSPVAATPLATNKVKSGGSSEDDTPIRTPMVAKRHGPQMHSAIADASAARVKAFRAARGAPKPLKHESRAKPIADDSDPW